MKHPGPFLNRPATEHQLGVLAMVDRLTRSAGGAPPTYRELARAAGVSPRAIQDSLESLQRRGLLLRAPKVARGLFLTSRGLELLRETRKAPASENPEDGQHATQA